MTGVFCENSGALHAVVSAIGRFPGCFFFYFSESWSWNPLPREVLKPEPRLVRGRLGLDMSPDRVAERGVVGSQPPLPAVKAGEREEDPELEDDVDVRVLLVGI